MNWELEDLKEYCKRTGRPLPPEFQNVKKPPKYHNIKTEYNGELLDSRKEATRAWELDQLQKQKELYYFKQLPFILPGGIEYCCDFLVLYPDGHYEIEDVKGYLTDEYKLKKKLMAEIGLKIKEV